MEEEDNQLYQMKGHARDEEVADDMPTHHAILVEVPQEGCPVAPTRAVHVDNQRVDAVWRRTQFL